MVECLGPMGGCWLGLKVVEAMGVAGRLVIGGHGVVGTSYVKVIQTSQKHFMNSSMF